MTHELQHRYRPNCTEIWKDIAGYEGNYQISNHYRVRSLKRTIMRKNGIPMELPEKYLKIYRRKDNYWGVALCKNGTTKCALFHRLIADAFIPNPERKPEVNHKNNNRLDCSVTNLEWVTHEENMQHASRIGVMKGRSDMNGESNTSAKLTSKDVKMIRILLRKGWTQQAIANKFTINQVTVSDIKIGKTWRSV